MKIDGKIKRGVHLFHYRMHSTSQSSDLMRIFFKYLRTLAVFLLVLLLGNWVGLCVAIFIRPPDTATSGALAFFALTGAMSVLLLFLAEHVVRPRYRLLPVDIALRFLGADANTIFQEAKLRRSQTLRYLVPGTALAIPVIPWVINAFYPSKALWPLVLVSSAVALVVLFLVWGSVRRAHHIMWCDFRDDTFQLYLKKNPGKWSRQDVRTGERSSQREYWLEDDMVPLTKEDLPDYLLGGSKH